MLVVFDKKGLCQFFLVYLMSIGGTCRLLYLVFSSRNPFEIYVVNWCLKYWSFKVFIAWQQITFKQSHMSLHSGWWIKCIWSTKLLKQITHLNSQYFVVVCTQCSVWYQNAWAGFKLSQLFRLPKDKDLQRRFQTRVCKTYCISLQGRRKIELLLCHSQYFVERFCIVTVEAYVLVIEVEWDFICIVGLGKSEMSMKKDKT